MKPVILVLSSVINLNTQEKNWNDLKLHQLKHTSEQLKCSHCDYETCYSRYLKCHQIKQTGKQLKCSHCNYETCNTRNLKRHQRIHPREQLKCSHCDYETCYPRYLKCHLQKHTGEIKMFSLWLRNLLSSFSQTSST